MGKRIEVPEEIYKRLKKGAENFGGKIFKRKVGEGLELNAQEMIEKLRDWYINKIYSNHKDKRGFTRIRDLIDSVYFNRFKNGDYYSYQYKGTRIDLWKKRHLTPMLSERVLDGYLKKYEIKEEGLVVNAGPWPSEFSFYTLKKGAKVISIDPNEKNANILKENFQLNTVPPNFN